MMKKLSEYIHSQLPMLDQSLVSHVSGSFVKCEYPKGKTLLHQGDVCKELYFLEAGVCRYFSLNGTDITTWFSFKNEFVTSFTSFFPKNPSYETIELITDSTLYSLNVNTLNQLTHESQDVLHIVNHFIIDYTIQLEHRLFSIQNLSATEKYQAMLKSEPHLIREISGKHLASYLGVSRETLSRIRSSIY